MPSIPEVDRRPVLSEDEQLVDDELLMDMGKRGPIIPDTSLRILVPASRTGSIIGKGGEYIQSLRQETGAKIKIANTMPGCEERAVHITSPESNCDMVPSQEALLKLLDRIFADELDNEGGSAKVMVRMLVDSSQVGPILGKAGSSINDMRNRSGANIRVIQGATDLPIFRGPTDELVQVTGDFDSVKEATHLLSQKLRDNPPRSRPGMPPPGGFPRPIGSVSLLFPIPQGLSTVVQSTTGFLQCFNGLVEAQFRMLVPDNKIGCVIGKGGDVIRQVREETKARVIVFNPIDGCDERIVMCRSMDEAPTLVCSAQEALGRCLYTLITEEDRSTGGQHCVRLLVPQDQIGAVLGKKGTVIKEIQLHTGAKLVVMSDNLPSCAQEEDELLEIRGRAQSVMQAVQACCTLIRVNMARSQAKEASAAMSASGSSPNHRISSPVHGSPMHGSPMHGSPVPSMHPHGRMMMPPAMVPMMPRPGMPMPLPGYSAGYPAPPYGSHPGYGYATHPMVSSPPPQSHMMVMPHHMLPEYGMQCPSPVSQR